MMLFRDSSYLNICNIYVTRETSVKRFMVGELLQKRAPRQVHRPVLQQFFYSRYVLLVGQLLAVLVGLPFARGRKEQMRNMGLQKQNCRRKRVRMRRWEFVCVRIEIRSSEVVPSKVERKGETHPDFGQLLGKLSPYHSLNYLLTQVTTQPPSLDARCHYNHGTLVTHTFWK